MSCFVYSICHSGRRRFLNITHSAESRSKANAWVGQRAKQGLPTHFLVVSSLPRRAATRRYCDGATWDELTCSYID